MLGFLLAWANAPFAVAAGIAAVFALLQVTGVLGLIAGGGDGDADHDVDADHDMDVDHDVDADHDADGDHDSDQDHDGDDRSWAAAALAPLGFGKIPFSVIWQVFAFAFALTGFLLNLRFMGQGAPPMYTLAWTLPSGLIAGYVGVAIVARVLGPVLSSTAQEATSRRDLVGLTGVVISTKVDAEFGEVRIRDKSGHDLRVVCKLAKSASKTPREHETVVVVDYSEDKGELLVEPFDLEEAAVRVSAPAPEARLEEPPKDGEEADAEPGAKAASRLV